MVIMKKFIKQIKILVIGFAFIAIPVFATTLLSVPQGGTGSSSMIGIPSGNGTSPYTAFTQDSSIAGNGTGGSPLAINVQHDSTLSGLGNSGSLLSVTGTSSGVTNVKVGTTVLLPHTSSTSYNNGLSGVGATITEDINGAIGTIDGATVTTSDRILVKNQTSTFNFQNGVYSLTAVGDGTHPFILTRTTDANTVAQINDELVAIATGTTQAGEDWGQTQTITAIDGIQSIKYALSNGVFLTQSPGCVNTAGELPFYTGNQRQVTCSSHATFTTLGDVLNIGDGVAGAGLFELNGNPFGALNNTLHNLVVGSTANQSLVGSADDTIVGLGAGTNRLGGTASGTYVGFNAGKNITTGTLDTAIGSATQAGTTGIKNTTLGSNSGGSETSAGSVTITGASSGTSITTGSADTLVGSGSGNTVTTANGLTILGAGANVSSTAVNNSVVIGNTATSSASNQFVVAGPPAISGGAITDEYLGLGPTTGITIANITHHGPDVSGVVDTSGGNNNLNGGISTGLAVGGDVVMSVTGPGAGSSSGQNTLKEGLRVRAPVMTSLNPCVKVSSVYILPCVVPVIASNQTIVYSSTGVTTFGPSVNSGVYTPVPDHIPAGWTATATPAQWSRVGATVTLSGETTVTSLGIGTYDIPLPIASAFIQTSQVAGGGFSDGLANESVRIKGDTVNNEMAVSILGALTAQTFSYTVTYQII